MQTLERITDSWQATRQSPVVEVEVHLKDDEVFAVFIDGEPMVLREAGFATVGLIAGTEVALKARGWPDWAISQVRRLHLKGVLPSLKGKLPKWEEAREEWERAFEYLSQE
jgi:hypothetical protein